MNRYIENSQKTFDQQAPHYDTSNYSKHAKIAYETIQREVMHLHFEDFLDLGCGTGEILRSVSHQRPQAQYYGLDLSSAMLQQARQKLPASIHLTQGDSASLPYPDASMDLVICNDSFHHYPLPLIVMHEVYRVLKHNGTFLLCDIYTKPIQRFFSNKALPFMKNGDVHLYNEKEICALMKTSGFTDICFQKIHATAFLVKAKK